MPEPEHLNISGDRSFIITTKVICLWQFAIALSSKVIAYHGIDGG